MVELKNRCFLLNQRYVKKLKPEAGSWVSDWIADNNLYQVHDCVREYM